MSTNSLSSSSAESNEPNFIITSHDVHDVVHDNVVMSSILKVKHNESSGHYCFCLLEQNSTGRTTLSVYKSKKVLSKKQRLKAKVYFVIEITPSISISIENSYTKFLFHIKNGSVNSSFSSHSTYNRDSWVQTLKSCQPTLDGTDTTHAPRSQYGKELHDHTGSSSFLSQKNIADSEHSQIMKSKPVKKASVQKLKDEPDIQVHRSQKLHAEVTANVPRIIAPSVSSSPKNLRATRQQFLSKIMSEKVSNATPQHMTNFGDMNDTSCLETADRPPPPVTPAQDYHRLTRRQKFLNTIMAEKEKESRNSSHQQDSALFEDEFDYVPPSTRKALPSPRNAESLRPALIGDSYPLYQYSSVDTPYNVPKYSKYVMSSKIEYEPQPQQQEEQEPFVHSTTQNPQTPAQSKFVPTNLNFSALSTRAHVTPAASLTKHQWHPSLDVSRDTVFMSPYSY